MPAIYTIEQAQIVTAGLNATEIDDWVYSVVDIGEGKAYIAAADDAGGFVDYLQIRLKAETTPDATRIEWKGRVITIQHDHA